MHSGLRIIPKLLKQETLGRSITLPTFFQPLENPYFIKYRKPAPEDWPAFSNNSLHVTFQETPEEYKATIDISGLPKEKMKITVHNQVLRINVEEEKKTDAEGYSMARIARMFTLPEDIDEKGIKAKEEGGKLNITIPRIEIKPPEERQVPIE